MRIPPTDRNGVTQHRAGVILVPGRGALRFRAANTDNGVWMRKAMFPLLVVLATPAVVPTAGAQRDVMIEVRPTFAIPAGKFAGAQLSTGPAFGITASTRLGERLRLYASWDWAHFAAENSFAGTNLDFEETGYAAGLRFERPIAEEGSIALRSEVGATWKHVAIENAAGDLIADSKYAFGYEAGLGVSFELSEDWRLIPMVRFRSATPEFTVGSSRTSGDLRYATLEFTLSRLFR